jgi:lysophospholipase L1-like esterase
VIRFLVAFLLGILVGRGVERHGLRSAGRVALKLSFALLVGLIALIPAEYLVRFRYRDATSGGNARQYIAQARARSQYALNRFGYREREIPPKAAGKYRIAAIGDSFTYGQGIEAADRFTNLLEGFLGSGYEVYNFGGPGNNLPEHQDTLEQALTVEPDFVLLQLFVNDFEMPEMMRPEPKPLLPSVYWDYWLQMRSILYDLASDRWATLQQQAGVTESYEHYMSRNLGDPNLPNARKAYGLLRQFIETARSQGVGVGVAFFPAIDAMSKDPKAYPFRYLDDEVRGICAEEDVPYLDLLETYSTVKDPRTLWVSAFDAHPNAAANKRATYEMLRVFGPTWQQR